MSPRNNGALASRLRDALVQLTPERPVAVEALRDLYADDIVFRDPIQEVHGIDAFLAMNRRLLGRMRKLEWSIERAVEAGDEIFLEWKMHGKTKLGVKVSVDGMTRARVRGGRIFDHRDYWDIAQLISSPVPGGERIMHALLSPLA